MANALNLWCSLHHDHGALGAEENYKDEYRRLKQMEGDGVTHPVQPTTLLVNKPANRSRTRFTRSEEALILGMAERNLMTIRFFEKDATHPEAKKGENGPTTIYVPMAETKITRCFYGQIGNEIGEANGDPHSLAAMTVKRLVISRMDKTSLCYHGSRCLLFGNGSGGHEKIAYELDAVTLTILEDNYKALRAKHPNCRFMDQKYLQPLYTQ